MKEVRVGPVIIGGRRPFVLIAGPCVVESEALCLETAAALADLTRSLGIPFIFKSSYDKANRSSLTSYRGPGVVKGLEILGRVRRELKVPVLSDVHRFEEVGAAGRSWIVCRSRPFCAGRRILSRPWPGRASR